MADTHGIAAHHRPMTWATGAVRFSSLFFLASDIIILSVAVPAIAGLGPVPEGLGELRIILAGALIAWAITMGHYTRRMATATELGQLTQGVCLIALADSIAVHHAIGQWDIVLVVARWLALLVSLLAGRYMVRRILNAAGLWRIPILVFGTGNAERIAAAMDSATSRGYHTVGVIHPEDTVGDLEARIDAACAQADIQMAVLDPEMAHGDQGKRLIRALQTRSIAIALAPSLAELPVLGIQAQNFFSHDVVLLTAAPTFGREVTQGAKRLLDIAASGVLLLLASPVLALVALAVKADGGPLFFGHLRVGQNGQPFRCWKFRTMVPNAEAVLKDVLAADPVRAEEWRQTLKLKNDPRVTSIGGFLRSASLDELPQLFNVLCGQMSLIGPRPVTKGELERYGEAQDYYLSVRPGITGLWQVLGRNDTSYGQRVLLDAWYVRNWSLWHDLIILLKTIPAVLRRSGAY